MSKPFEEDIATAEEKAHLDDQVPTLGPGEEILPAQAQDPDVALGPGEESEESEENEENEEGGED